MQPTLEAYLALLNARFPSLLHALYLEGSIALGGFNERFSDVDFIAVLTQPPAAAEVAALRRIHRKIAREHPRWPLSGVYIQPDHLSAGNYSRSHLRYHDNWLRRDDSFQTQSVEGWILKKRGIALLGPAPQSLPYEVDWPRLLVWMRANLNSYWAGWTRRPRRILTLLTGWGVQWAVLGVLRQFYSFRENSITTKEGAGQYALAQLPAAWHPLIQEALAIRAGKASTPHHTRIPRARQTVRFLAYIIQTCPT